MPTYYSNTNNGYRLRLEVTQVSQSIANNTSNISYALYLEATYANFGTWGHTRSLSVDGTSVYSVSNQISIAKNSSLLLHSGTRTISHNSNGTKSIALVASFDANTRAAWVVSSALTINTSMTLTTIPREGYLNSMNNFTIGNSTSISYYSYSTSFNYKFHLYVGSTFLQEFSSYSVSGTNSLTITPSTASQTSILNAIANGGTSVTVSIYMGTFSGSTQIGGWTAAKTATASTRASTISSFGNFSITGTSTSTISVSRGNSLLKHHFEIYVGSTRIFDSSNNSSATYSGTLNDSIRQTILGAFSTGGTSTTVQARVTTRNPANTRNIGSQQTSNASATISVSTVSGFSNFNITNSSAGTITISRATSLLRHIYVIKVGSTSLINSGYNTSTTYTGSLNDTIRGQILSTFSNGHTSATITAEVTTYYSTTRIGTAQTRTATASISAAAFSGTTGNFPLNTGTTPSSINRSFGFSSISSLLTKTVTVAIGSFSKSASSTGTSATVELTGANQNSIYSILSNATSGTMSETLTTYYGNTRIGSSVSRNVTITIPHLPPVISGVSIIDTSPTYAAMGNTSIKGYARPKISVTAAGQKYATISSYSITFNSLTTNTNGYTFPVVSGSGTFTADVTVTDSRGRTTSHDTTSLTVLDYFSPVINTFITNRSNGTEEDLLGNRLLYILEAVGSASGNNQITLEVKRKLRSESEWTLVYSDIDNTDPLNISYTRHDTSFVYDPGLSYDIDVLLSDNINSHHLTTVVATGQVPLAISDEGIGVGGVPQVGRVLDVYGDIYMTGILQSGSVPWARISGAPTFITSTLPFARYDATGAYEGQFAGGILNVSATTSVSSYYVGYKSGSSWYRLRAGYADSAGSVAWGDVSGKPSTFAPSTHSHAWSTITSRPADNQFPNTAQVIGSSQNLNNYTTPGFYFQNSNANASSGSNYPIAHAGTLIVTKDAGTTQMYYHYNGSGVYYRTLYGSTWTPWRTLWHSGNISQPAQSNWGSAPSSPRPGDMYFT